MVVGGVEVDSVNGAMDRSQWAPNKLLRVGQFAEAVAIMQGAARQRRVALWSLDCEAFYRVVGRQRAELWRNGIWLPDGVQLDERCCFGDASAAVKCARISNFLVAQIRLALEAIERCCIRRWTRGGWCGRRRGERRRRQLGGPTRPTRGRRTGVALAWHVHRRLDGGERRRRGGDARRTVCEPTTVLHFEAARAVLARFGWRSAPSKEQPPRLRLEVLGVVVDAALSRMLLSEGKRERYAAQARRVADMRYCMESEFRELVGRLQFASSCYPIGRQDLHAAWRALRVRMRTEGRVRVGRSVGEDLLSWACMLEDDEH